MSNKWISIMLAILLLVGSISVVLTLTYFGHYNQDSKSTATTGIFFQKTLHLDKYQVVSNGNGLWGKYERYSRSDRHNEAITVYCNKFCSKQ